MALLAVALIAVVAYVAAPSRHADVVVAPEPGCDPNRAPCTARLPDGARLEFSILPRPIPVVAPLRVEVKLEGIAPGSVEVDFSGADMDMGPNRATLRPAPGGSYVGTATLPVCVTGTMNWRANVMIGNGHENGARRIVVAIPFVAPR